MATLSSISFKNFYNFYGDHEYNFYQFSEGLNLVIADNGNGKSKFFNGFLWITKNQAFDSDSKELQSTNLDRTRFLMVSDKAKAEAQVNNIIQTEVKIELKDSRYNYSILKRITAKKLNDGGFSQIENWEFLDDTRHVTRSKLNLETIETIGSKEDEDRIIRKIIKPGFMKYLLLQGEAVDNIVNFSNPETLEEAINTLTNIDQLNAIQNVSSEVKKKSSRYYDNRLSLSKKHKNKIDDLLAEKKVKEDRLEDIKTLRDGHNKELDILEYEINKMEDSYADQENFQKWLSEKKKLKNLIEIKSNQEEELILKLNKKFFEPDTPWLVCSIENSFKDFFQKRKKYKGLLQKKITNNELKKNVNEYTLGPDVPDLLTLEDMKEENTCFVCGTKVPEGSNGYKRIESLIKQRSIENQKELEIKEYHFDTLLGELLNNTKRLQKSALNEDQINNSIINYKQQIKNIRTEIDDDKKKIKELDSLMDNVNLDDNESSNFLKSFKNKTSRKYRLENEVNAFEKEIQQIEERLPKIESNLKEYDEEESTQDHFKMKEVTALIDDTIIKVKEDYFNEIIQNLEKEANKHLPNLVQYNRVKPSYLKFRKTKSGNVIIEVIDKDNNVVRGESEGFQRMKKIAVILAIISSSKRGSLNYPLIADAPFSSFGKGFIKGFLEEVPNVIGQSIILVKELYDQDSNNEISDVGNELINKSTAKNVYLLKVTEGVPQREKTTEKATIV